MKKLGGLVRYIKNHEKRLIFLLAAELIVLVIVAQFLYPTNKLLPFTSVDNISLSGWSKADATGALNNHYNQLEIPIYLGQENTVLRTVKTADIGLDVDNNERIANISYPWYLRLVPSSILWASFFTDSAQPKLARDDLVMTNFINNEMKSGSCFIEPKNANIRVLGGELSVEDAVDGGTCTSGDIRTALESYNPVSTKDIRIAVRVDSPDVTTADAQELKEIISQRISEGVDVVVLGESVFIGRDKLVEWLDFSVVKGKLDFSFNEKRAESYLGELFASKVSVKATATIVTTNDFVETSRKPGLDGQKLDVGATLNSIKAHINDEGSIASVATAKVKSPIEYHRKYTNTNTGLMALMQNFASSHKGSYGITLVELSGQYRWASHNGDKQFVTASIYKLFVAYSTLLRIENGSWKWTDKVDGDKNTATCFDDMIVISDNNCAKALLERIGFTNITNEAHALGCTNTSFLGTNIISSSRDIASLLSSLAKGEILKKQSSRDRWISAMKRNVYRQGIPSGVSAVVADKVGFLWDLLHDAGIVYSPHGTYVLVVMTNKSSWANIAELTHQLDQLISK